ncbi:LppP/LprE family lipoprotein [Actinomyces haliotis]|uniref:LppP/LprE family lipoprotein n=1 Tax=Actinomyces haliotis TaxID=1280843 RepID=UPI00188F360E|nr:LppP/LprE family lipoprotein [Actinomyces haliotis]
MTPSARSRSLATLALAAALTLAGCGGTGSSSGSDATQASASASTTASASASATAQASDEPLAKSSADATQASDTSCKNLTEDQAIAEAKPHLKSYGTDSWAPLSDDAAFDPCADLSAIRLYQTDGSTDSAQFVLLFHKGSFYSTARTEPVGVIMNTVRQVDAKTIEFDLIKEDTEEDLMKTTPDATLRYTWNEGSKKVVQSGDLPYPEDALPSPVDTFSASGATASSSAAVSSGSAPVAGAYAGAGGARPSQATEATGIYHSPYGGDDLALILSPSGNIECDISSSDIGCGAKESDWRVVPDEGPAIWAYGLGETGEPTTIAKGDDFMAGYEPGSAQTVRYGQVVYYGNFVVASAENGITVWSTKSGHGFLMNKQEVLTF